MASRLNLHEVLCEILGSRNVYFNPPESFKMNYPAIRYTLTTPNIKKANNGVYQLINQYEVTVIDPDPDSSVPNQILSRFSMCKWNRFYTADNLAHTVLTIFY